MAKNINLLDDSTSNAMTGNTGKASSFRLTNRVNHTMGGRHEADISARGTGSKAVATITFDVSTIHPLYRDAILSAAVIELAKQANTDVSLENAASKMGEYLQGLADGTVKVPVGEKHWWPINREEGVKAHTDAVLGDSPSTPKKAIDDFQAKHWPLTGNPDALMVQKMLAEPVQKKLEIAARARAAVAAKARADKAREALKNGKPELNAAE